MAQPESAKAWGMNDFRVYLGIDGQDKLPKTTLSGREQALSTIEASYLDADGVVVGLRGNAGTPFRLRKLRKEDRKKYVQGDKTLIKDILTSCNPKEFRRSFDTAEKLPDDDSRLGKEFERFLRYFVDMTEGRAFPTKMKGKESSTGQVRPVRNLIYFGAPGTGKSYTLNKKVREQFRGNVERVTFYADYLHSQFVGSYKPMMADDDKDIKYEFQPGPFARVLVDSLNDKNNNDHCLIIEELNRTEAASVFGDLFQLLDRNSEGVSQYPVSVSEDFKKYLGGNLAAEGKDKLDALVKKALGSDEVPNGSCGMIVIPPNMYIWATMNSADQGVFPLDTAFKRRWNFQYFPLDEGEKELRTENDKYWNAIRKAINRKLVGLGINEDKCMGPFFLNEEERNNGFDDAFKNKVIMYLFEDAAKYHKELFSRQDMTLSDLFNAWDDKKEVFCEDVVKDIPAVSPIQQEASRGDIPDESNEQPGEGYDDTQDTDSDESEQAQDEAND